MRLLVFSLLVFLIGVQRILAQNFSGFAHDCGQTGYNGDYSVVYGVNCAFNVTSIAATFPKQSALSLNNCLTFDSPSLVGHQG